MKRRTRKSVLKSCMDREEREVGVNSVGESRMDKTGSGWKKVKGIGNVVLNTRKLHWISESKMMNTRNSYYNKRKKMDKLDENWEAANWARTAGGGKLNENHGWTSGASGKKLRAVKWNVGELAMNCLASDSKR